MVKVAIEGLTFKQIEDKFFSPKEYTSKNKLKNIRNMLFNATNDENVLVLSNLLR